MTLANLGERDRPRRRLNPDLDHDPALTDQQRQALAALTRCLNDNGSADTIAHIMGYRPARHGRLAVTRMLRALLEPGKDVGPYVVRLPGRDQWSPATWSLRHKHVQYVDEDGRPCRFVMEENRWHLIEPEAPKPELPAMAKPVSAKPRSRRP